MDILQQIVWVGGLFLLRLGVPLAVVMLLGYWLRRLDAKWQAEAMARRATELAKAEIAADRRIEIYKVIDQPCWVTNSCAAEVRENCPACKNPQTPCWMARYRAEGKLMARCYTCQFFAPRRTQVNDQIVVKN